MTADAGASPDNLDKAQQLISRSLESSRHYSAAQTEIAKALALIDIGRSLRDIHVELHDLHTEVREINWYGVKRKP